MDMKSTRKSPRLLQMESVINLVSPDSTQHNNVKKHLDFDEKDLDTPMRYSEKRTPEKKGRKTVTFFNDEQQAQSSKISRTTGTPAKKRKKTVTFFDDEQKGQSAKKIRTTGASGKKKMKRVQQSSKKGGKDEWLSLTTRSSPLQLYKCVKGLKEKQRDAVVKMGFGKILQFKIDGIPGKLAHYVVDNFDPDKMEIKVENGSIKIDEMAIHRLLGIPCEGLQIHKMEPFDSMAYEVKEWRARYPGRFIPVTNIVENIEQAADGDTFFFRLDFLMMFITIMVECHSQGTCREYLFKKITMHTDFSQIDWCAYVIQAMKPCKRNWRRCDPGSQFAGPLTILTLLYVQNVECKGIKVDNTIAAIEFWNKQKFKRRQELEILRGGFGGRTNKGVTLPNMFKKKPSYVKETDQSDKIAELSGLIDKLIVTKEEVEIKLEDIKEIIPENEHVLKLIKKYESLFDATSKRQKGFSVEKKIDNVLHDISVKFDEEEIDTDSSEEENDDDPETGKGAESRVECANDNAAMESGIEKNVEHVKDATDIVDRRVSADGTTDLPDIRTEAAKETVELAGDKRKTVPGTIQIGVNLHDPITEEESKVWRFLTKNYGTTKSSIIIRATETRPPFTSARDFLFKGKNIMIERYLMKSLEPGNLVSNAVVDAWVDVLNFEETLKKTGSCRRLFCGTNTLVEWMLKLQSADDKARVSAFEKKMFGAVYRNSELTDLRSFDLVFFPILEHAHFYVIVFELTCPAISIIDNRARATKLSRIIDNEDFFQKDTPYKVKDIFVRYLEMKGHPKAKEMANVKVTRVKISWATTGNGTDCGVFTMRHMEKYMGVGEEFDCQFTSEGSLKKKQLEALRKKIAAHILLSEANEVRNDIKKVALAE